MSANYSLSSIKQNLLHAPVQPFFTTICTTTFLLFYFHQQHHTHILIVLPEAPLSQSCLNCFTTNTATTVLLFHHMINMTTFLLCCHDCHHLRFSYTTIATHHHYHSPISIYPSITTLTTTHGYTIYRSDSLRRTLAFLLS